jgi:hypothetical protein
MDELLRSLPGPHFEKTQVGRAIADLRKSFSKRDFSPQDCFGLHLSQPIEKQIIAKAHTFEDAVDCIASPPDATVSR